MAKLTLEDIVDLRAYERERAEFRAHIIQLKKKRRLSVGPFVTLLFENAETIRFQIQEMARVEKILTDEGIETELRIYNPLIPEPGELAATLFIELTNEADLREWLPKLVGIEREVELRFGGADGSAPDVVRARVDADHEKQLTRDEITASVHYLHFSFTPAQVEQFGHGPVVLALTHPEYQHEIELGPDPVAELGRDLVHGG
jgi:hypothetical protein